MAAEIDRDFPVLMLDTLMLFQETLDYQTELAERLGLTNVQQPAARSGGRTGPIRRHPAPVRLRRLLRDPQGDAARPGAGALSGDDIRAQALPGGDAGGDRGVTRRTTTGCGSTRWRAGAPGRPRLHQPRTSCRAPAGGEGLSVDRLRPVHHAGQAGRRPQGRAVARHREARYAGIHFGADGRIRQRERWERDHGHQVTEAGHPRRLGRRRGAPLRRLLVRAGICPRKAWPSISQRPRPGRPRAVAGAAGADPRRLPGDGRR